MAGLYQYELESDGGGSSAVVANYDPAPGTPIPPNQPIAFDVTGADHGIEISVDFPNTSVTELAMSGTTFTPDYAFNSTATPISGGFHYSLLRRGGWLGSPTIDVEALGPTEVP